jgi:hypothetical protein
VLQSAAAVDVAVGATLEPAPDCEPRTPEGVPEDVMEESEEEPEVALEPVPEVVRKEAPAEGAMIAVRPHGGGSSPILWCTSTIFIAAPHGRGLGGCHRRRNGGGPRASHPLRARQHLPR